MESDPTLTPYVEFLRELLKTDVETALRQSRADLDAKRPEYKGRPLRAGLQLWMLPRPEAPDFEEQRRRHSTWVPLVGHETVPFPAEDTPQAFEAACTELLRQQSDSLRKQVVEWNTATPNRLFAIDPVIFLCTCN